MERKYEESVQGENAVVLLSRVRALTKCKRLAVFAFVLAPSAFINWGTSVVVSKPTLDIFFHFTLVPSQKASQQDLSDEMEMMHGTFTNKRYLFKERHEHYQFILYVLP